MIVMITAVHIDCVKYFKYTENTCVQLDVTYQLRLRLYGSKNHRAVIANDSNVINITVLANNFPFGLFSFPHVNYSVTVGKHSDNMFISL